MRTLKTIAAVGALALTGLALAPATAKADPPWHRHGWYRPAPPAYYYRPRPYYYAPPPRVYYAPPPAYYAPPPPVYYAPRPSVGLYLGF